MTSKDNSLSFPVPFANPFSFPNPNPYQPNKLAISQTSQQQQLQVLRSPTEPKPQQ